VFITFNGKNESRNNTSLARQQFRKKVKEIKHGYCACACVCVNVWQNGKEVAFNAQD
jgi:hypothetical protein